MIFLKEKPPYLTKIKNISKNSLFLTQHLKSNKMLSRFDILLDKKTFVLYTEKTYKMKIQNSIIKKN